jgi:hypothetical protein
MLLKPQNSTCFSERPVFDSVDSARRIEVMLKTAELARSFRRLSTLKKQAFFTKPCRAHFCARFGGRFFPQLALPNLFTNFRGSFVFSSNSPRFFVADAQMFVIAKALEVFQPIIGFVFINVMNVTPRYVFFAPHLHYHAMNKIVPAAQVAVGPAARRKRLELSENFPAAGYSIACVKNAVVNAVKSNRKHVFSC